MKRALFLLIVLGALGGFGVLLKGRVDEAKAERAHLEPADTRPPAVELGTLVRRDFARSFTVAGTIAARDAVQVFAKVGGKVEDVRADVGQEVVAGEVLAVVEHGQLDWQVRQAQAAQAAAQAGVAVSQAQRDAAATEVARARALAKDDAIARADVERAEAGLKTAEAAVKAARAQVRVAAAAVGLAKEARSYAEITSPIAGIVTSRSVDKGQMVGPQRPVFEVQDRSALKVVARVPARVFGDIQVGRTRASVRVQREGEARMAGTVTKTDLSLDPMSRRVAIEVTLDEAPPDLLANTFVEATLDLGARRGVLAAPARAVLNRASGAVVFVVRGGRAVAVPAHPSEAEDGFVPVDEGASGARAGEAVVVAGQSGLHAGVAVRTAPGAAANGAGAEAPAQDAGGAGATAADEGGHAVGHEEGAP